MRVCEARRDPRLSDQALLQRLHVFVVGGKQSGSALRINRRSAAMKNSIIMVVTAGNAVL